MFAPRSEMTELRSDRKSGFLIRDILPDSVETASPFGRPDVGHLAATGLDLLQVRPWDCRLLLSPDPAMGTGRSGGSAGPLQQGRVLPSCGAVCCVMCSASGGCWPTGAFQFSELLQAHSGGVLPVVGGAALSPSALHGGHGATLPWPPSLNQTPFAALGGGDSSPHHALELSSSPQPHMSMGIAHDLAIDSRNLHHSLNGKDRSSSPGGSSSVTRKVRRNRTVFTELQLMGLERRFDSQKYLSTPDRAELARALGLTQLQVKTWYQNRRMKWKKQVMQGGCTVPPTKPKGRPKKNSIPSLAECDAAAANKAYLQGGKSLLSAEYLSFPAGLTSQPPESLI